ncbi:hypothetical protein C8035_v001636 [Colletotrichum spinosum]|uniref:Uncharacterized protein n=1 Tax=Colletotrichum spinosum TaxID=1347390 RepID=A0A4R8QCD1_9PEZI|nr:hypothetical protein C8035_v001636 [Colletotrichum spinosum]
MNCFTILSLLLWIGTVSANTYTLTYGDDTWICHATFDVAVNHDEHNAIVTTSRAFCTFTHSEGIATFVLPLYPENSRGVNAYALSLGPLNQQGHFGLEIGVDQPATTFANNVQVPAFNPRFDFYFNNLGQPLGPCNYRQGGLQLAAGDGIGVHPYRSCPPGSPRTHNLGRWFSCIIPCNRF